MRVAAIAIDAAEWSLIERLMAAGHLPRLRDIAARGTRVRLRNEQAYRSELAWVQFLTGQTASDLGWWGQLQFEPATYAAYGSGTLDAAPFYALGPQTSMPAVLLTQIDRRSR